MFFIIAFIVFIVCITILFTKEDIQYSSDSIMTCITISGFIMLVILLFDFFALNNNMLETDYFNNYITYKEKIVNGINGNKYEVTILSGNSFFHIFPLNEKKIIVDNEEERNEIILKYLKVIDNNEIKNDKEKIKVEKEIP